MTTEDVNGRITVSLVSERIILAIAWGHIRLDHVLAAQAAIERLFRPIAGTVDLIFDGTAVETFEPGLPNRWVRWSARHVARVGRVAMVTRSGPMIAATKTALFLLPTLRLAFFADRPAAIAFLGAVTLTDHVKMLLRTTRDPIRTQEIIDAVKATAIAITHASFTQPNEASGFDAKMHARHKAINEMAIGLDAEMPVLPIQAMDARQQVRYDETLERVRDRAKEIIAKHMGD